MKKVLLYSLSQFIKKNDEHNLKIVIDWEMKLILWKR